MRTIRWIALALCVGAMIAVASNVLAGGNKNPVAAGKAVATGPSVELVGIAGDEIPDPANANGTYTAVDEFDGLSDQAVAGIRVDVKPGGKPEAHLLIGYAIRVIPATAAKKDKKGRVTEPAKPEKKVADPTKPVLKGYVPQDGTQADNVRYTTFSYASEAKKDVDESTIRGMVTAQPGDGIMLKANGIPLTIVQLLKNKSGTLALKVYHVKVEPLKVSEATPTTSSNPAPK